MKEDIPYPTEVKKNAMDREVKRIKRPVREICMRCKHYRCTMTGPYCCFTNTYHTQAREWLYDDTITKPGLRTCKHWEN